MRHSVNFKSSLTNSKNKKDISKADFLFIYKYKSQFQCKMSKEISAIT